MKRLWAAGALAVGSLLACQTITEELPVQSSPVLNATVPVVVVPIPVPVAATPAPAPNPNPAPNPAPPPDEGFIPNNNAPVVKLGAKVFFLECNGALIPGSENARETDVGCRIHYDSTPKDANNAPTRSRGTPSWSFNNMSLIKVGKTVDFTPTVTALKSGTLVAWAEVDGIRSADVVIRIR